jgi:hypothetical protein
LSALLLINIPWFLTEGKLAAIFITTFSWGFPTGQSFTTSQQVFWHHHHRAINKFSSAVAGDFLHQLYFPLLTWHHETASKFSGAVAREEWKTSARGVFRTHILYFVLLFCFTLFLPASFYIQKPKKFRILGSCYFFTFSSSCCSLSTFWRTSQ